MRHWRRRGAREMLGRLTRLLAKVRRLLAGWWLMELGRLLARLLRRLRLELSMLVSSLLLLKLLSLLCV